MRIAAADDRSCRSWRGDADPLRFERASRLRHATNGRRSDRWRHSIRLRRGRAPVDGKQDPKRADPFDFAFFVLEALLLSIFDYKDEEEKVLTVAQSI